MRVGVSHSEESFVVGDDPGASPSIGEVAPSTLKLSSLITDYLAGNPERNQPRLHEAAKDVCRVTAVHGGTYLICASVTNNV